MRLILIFKALFGLGLVVFSFFGVVFVGNNNGALKNSMISKYFRDFYHNVNGDF